jgi:uncharacterized protein (TIGR00251 family)
MIAIVEHPQGCILPVRAQPGARRNGVLGEQAGSLKVAVTAPPEDGRANKALIEVLRKALGVKRSQIEIVSGVTSREKRVLVLGMTTQDLQTRLRAIA